MWLSLYTCNALDCRVKSGCHRCTSNKVLSVEYLYLFFFFNDGICCNIGQQNGDQDSEDQAYLTLDIPIVQR